MAAGQPDFVNGVDFTLYVTQTAAMHNLLVSGGTPSDDRGLLVVTTDTALNTPDVPNPNTSSSYTKWKRYGWVRRPHSSASDTSPILYLWDENATSVAVYLKWVRLQADTSVIQSELDALTLRVEDLEATNVTLQALVNTANSNAATANTNASAALSTANTANANALQALSDLDTPTTGVKARVTSLEGRMTTAETNITSVQASITTINNTINTSLPSIILESASFPMATGVIGTFPHGLGAVPKYVKGVLVCAANDAATGLVIGDEIDLSSITQTAANTTFGVIVNATNIIFTLDPALTTFNLPHKTTGTKTVPTSTNNFRIKCYYSKQ